ncbi:PEP-CTERM protein-sorting domain-containing protein [Verrucomicrobium sp. GAS474]|uniref:beta strand repeat-containing protein n=1 Tax=Verrucomicrobium sp. GAS474 TaxID=1882831 RepID=UPI00087BD5AA|nr:autotransporter-associated beta strand repeat-containing protein [Verrucomicrobium sp. GAS474]SDT98610.1 PEP-CTERM protein-sorting domain-containing protein [Verrucomicrobium sp. GAS474]
MTAEGYKKNGRGGFILVLVLALFCAAAGRAGAASYYWDSTPATTSWGDSSDWSRYAATGTNGAPSSSATSADTYVFDASTSTSLNDNLSGLTLGSLSFTTNAAAYTLGGNAFSLYKGITTRATTAEAISAGIALAGANTWNVYAGGALNVSGVVSGANSLTLGGGYGGGTVTLSGANTYSGGTILRGGSLNLTGSLNAAGTLNLGGGTLTYAPTAGGSTQAFASTTVSPGLSTVANATAGNNVNLGTITRNAGGLLNVSSVTGTTKAGNGNTNGILGAWATVGSGSSLRYATVTGGNIASYTGATAATTNMGNISSATTNYSFTANVSQILGNVTANTITYTGTGGNWTNALSAANLNGLMNAGTGALTLNFTTLGAINIGTTAAAGNSELVVTTNDQTLTINATINNYTFNTGSLTLGSVGNGTIVLGNSNNYTGGTTITSGTVQLGNAGALSSGTVTLAGGTLQGATGAGLTISNSLVVTGGLSAISSSVATSVLLTGAISGSGTLATEGAGAAGAMVGFTNTSVGGYSGFTGTLLFRTAGQENWSFGSGNTIAATFDFSNATLVMDGSASTRTVGFYGASANQVLKLGELSGGGTIIGSTSGTNTLSVGYLGTDSVFAGAIGVTGGNKDNIALTKEGAGTLVLSGANVYTGSTSVNTGTLQVGNGTSGSIGATSSATVAAGATLSFDMANGSTFSKAIVNSGTVAGVEDPGVTNTLSGVVSGTGGLTQAGAGTTVLTGTDTYTGATSVSAGTLQVGNGTSGSVAATASVSVASGATVAFDMANGSTLSKAISNSGSVVGAEGAGITNTLSGVVSGSGAFTQTGAGTTVLSGANTYTGGTTIQAGKVTLGNAAGLGASANALTILGGATLDLSGNSAVVGALSGSGGGSALLMNSSAATPATLAASSVNPGGALTVGTLTVGGVSDTAKTTLALTNAVLNFDLAGAGSNDKIVLNGKGAVTFTTSQLALTGTIAAGNYTFVTAANNASGIFYNTNLANDLGLTASSIATLASLGLAGTLSQVPDGTGYDITLSITAVAVPEPGTWMLMGMGLAFLGLAAARRRRMA